MKWFLKTPSRFTWDVYVGNSATPRSKFSLYGALDTGLTAMNSSLRARLFTRTLVMLAITLAVVFSGTQLIARNSLQKAQDNALQAVAQVIADSVTRENGQLTFDLPFEAFEVLAYQSQEALAFQVSDGEQILAGAQDLPLILPRVPGQLTHAYTQVFNSEPMRFFYLNKPIRGTQSIAIVISQTQTGLVREVNGLALQAAAFCLVAFLLVSGLLYGVLNLALRPLRSIEKALAKRADDDFSKLDTQVPKEISTAGRLNRVMGTHNYWKIAPLFIKGHHQLRTPIAALAARANLIARNAAPGLPRTRRNWPAKLGKPVVFHTVVNPIP